MSPSIGNWLSRERSSSWPSCSISCAPAASPIKRGDLTTEDTKNRNGLEFGVRLNGPHGVAPNPELRTPSPERISPQRHRGHQESKWIRVGRQVEWPAQCGSEPRTPNSKPGTDFTPTEQRKLLMSQHHSEEEDFKELAAGPFAKKITRRLFMRRAAQLGFSAAVLRRIAPASWAANDNLVDSSPLAPNESPVTKERIEFLKSSPYKDISINIMVLRDAVGNCVEYHTARWEEETGAHVNI